MLMLNMIDSFRLLTSLNNRTDDIVPITIITVILILPVLIYFQDKRKKEEDNKYKHRMKSNRVDENQEKIQLTLISLYLISIIIWLCYKITQIY